MTGCYYLRVPNYVMSGLNAETVYGVSLEDCLYNCMRRTDFQCRSFDWFHAGCRYSTKTRLTRPTDYTPYTDDYLEKVCSNATQTGEYLCRVHCNINGAKSAVRGDN